MYSTKTRIAATFLAMVILAVVATRTIVTQADSMPPVLQPAFPSPRALARTVTVQSLPPVVVKTEPQSGFTDVDPSITELRVTFSKPMTDGDWAWAQISDDTYPKTTGRPRFLDDHKTCVLPVKLESGKTYVIWLNLPPYDSFQDTDGHRAVRYLLAFQTK